MASNTKKKKKKKSTSAAARVMKIIGLCLLVIVLLFVIFFVIYFASNGFGGSYSTFIAKVNGETILSSRTITLPSGSTVKVYSLSDYTLSIVATDAEEGEDFVFTVDGNDYLWSDYAGEDFTAGFEITEEDDGTLTITYSLLDEILSVVFGAEVTISEGGTGEIFELVIESGSSSLHLPFSLEYDYQINVEPDCIIF